MNANSSQIGHIPIEPYFENNGQDQSNLPQLLSGEIIVTSQPLRQFNTTNMIPSQIPLIPRVPRPTNITNITTRQLGRRRRRRRRQQRQSQGRRQRRRQRQRQRRGEQRSQQQQPRYQRPRRWSEIEEDEAYWASVGFQDYMEENISPALEAYYWERMDPHERRERWEQAHLQELERMASLEQQAASDYFGFVVLEQLALIQDEMEQRQQIETVQTIREEEEEQQERENAELIQLKQWKHSHF